MMILESVGACELSSEMLRISEELKNRDAEEFDEVDVWRLMKTAENLIFTIRKIQFSKHLSEKDRKMLSIK